MNQGLSYAKLVFNSFERQVVDKYNKRKKVRSKCRHLLRSKGQECRLWNPCTSWSQALLFFTFIESKSFHLFLQSTDIFTLQECEYFRATCFCQEIMWTLASARVILTRAQIENDLPESWKQRKGSQFWVLVSLCSPENRNKTTARRTRNKGIILFTHSTTNSNHELINKWVKNSNSLQMYTLAASLHILKIT